MPTLKLWRCTECGKTYGERLHQDFWVLHNQNCSGRQYLARFIGNWVKDRVHD